jgi:DNA-binding FadR family transcriptional regulator
MIFHGGRLDGNLVKDMFEVMQPLLFEMARLAIERRRPEQIEALRALRDVIADERRDREERFASVRELQVLLSDMTQNRVWQMLARRMRAFLASEPLRETRRRLRRDPARVVAIVDACLGAIDAGRPDDAIAALRRLTNLFDPEWTAPAVRAPKPARRASPVDARTRRRTVRRAFVPASRATGKERHHE